MPVSKGGVELSLEESVRDGEFLLQGAGGDGHAHVAARVANKVEHRTLVVGGTVLFPVEDPANRAIPGPLDLHRVKCDGVANVFVAGIVLWAVAGGRDAEPIE